MMIYLVVVWRTSCSTSGSQKLPTGSPASRARSSDWVLVQRFRIRGRWVQASSGIERDSEVLGDQGSFGWVLGGPGGVPRDEKRTRMVWVLRGRREIGSLRQERQRRPEAEGDQGASLRVVVPASA